MGTTPMLDKLWDQFLPTKLWAYQLIKELKLIRIEKYDSNGFLIVVIRTKAW